MMTVHSRSSSLRFAAAARGDDPSMASPPSKKPRLQNDVHRKSSPDLLSDPTAIENKSTTPRSSTHQTNKATTPAHARSQLRRPLLAAQPVAPINNNTLRTKGYRKQHRDSLPRGTSTPILIRDGRESPDPLDTISPAAPVARTRARAISSSAALPAVAARTPPTTAAPEPKQPSKIRATRNSLHRSRRTPDPAVPENNVAKKGPHEPSIMGQPPGRSRRVHTVGEDELTKPSGSFAHNVPASTGHPPVATERRSLRSHDGGSRSKSELAQYFSNYEQLISLEPTKTESLTASTVVKLIDDLTESPHVSLKSTLTATGETELPDDESPFGNPLVNLHDCEVLSLPDPALGDDDEVVDPLNEGVYLKAHRKMERQEKQIRNIEKERAQHEKMQLERLLDDLQGHDWLRVMGISGITDTEKKLYEPKRDYFVKEVSTLLEKFRIWKEEEKRRKLEKDRDRDREIMRHRTSSQAPGSAHPDATDGESRYHRHHHSDSSPSPSDGADETPPNGDIILSDTQSYQQPPDPHDVDAWAAWQLLQEAQSASGPKAKKRPKSTPDKHKVDVKNKDRGRTKRKTAEGGTKKTDQDDPSVWSVPPSPGRVFTSFYTNKHLRDTALSLSHRKGGRLRSAFGQPLPEMKDREFALPRDVLTGDAIQMCRRKRRRVRRESRG